jgi:hypothetical protein
VSFNPISLDASSITARVIPLVKGSFKFQVVLIYSTTIFLVFLKCLTDLIQRFTCLENFTFSFVTIPQIFTRARGSLAASAHEVGTAQVRVLIECLFVEIVIESETCHIYRAVLLTI